MGNNHFMALTTGYLLLLLLLLHDAFAVKFHLQPQPRPRPHGRTTHAPPAIKGSNKGGNKGHWQVVLKSSGVVAMHMALTHYNTVIMFDQKGTAGYRLHSRRNAKRCKMMQDSSCFAHSVEYDLERNLIRPLHVNSDTWCSSGSMMSNGTLMQTGGYGDGSRDIRYFRPCANRRCDWRQAKSHLSDERWYASNVRLPENDDRVIIVGGRSVFSYEFVPKRSPKEGAFRLPFLHQTYDTNEGGNNLYPIVHLNSDGHLFIFANRESILFDYKRSRVVKTYPKIPGKGARSYPSTGSSVLLPLDHSNSFKRVEVMICGGAAPGAYSAAREGRFLRGLRTCGRLEITGKIHKWKMEFMPEPRLMSDMIILPNGRVLIINGVKHGCAGWNSASDPALKPYLYNPKKQQGKRFSILKGTKIARMYHSSAILLPDGRILVGGSNPNNRYVFSKVAHPTELRLQAFSPPYMDRKFDNRRPHNVTIFTNWDDEVVPFGQEFNVRFLLSKKMMLGGNNVIITVYAPPFNTHSMSMNQRLLILNCKRLVRTDEGWMSALVDSPPSPKVAPPGYYLLTVVNGGIPSRSLWIKFSNV